MSTWVAWAQHIEFLSKKIARNVGILSKLKHFLPMYIMNTLYYSLILFADDTSLFHAHTDFDTLIEEINEELQKITTWFHTNKLSLNIKKKKNS